MGVIGKGASSFKKKDVMEQKSIALGFKKIRFAHKATFGDTAINLNSLVLPAEMSANGFTNPATTDILSAQLYTFRNNLKLVSSSKGLLIDQLSYVVSGNSTITFLGFTAEDGEIFTGWMDDMPTTSLNVVDGQSIVATGPLVVGQTDFNVGSPIEINKYPAQQVGAVVVYRNGLIQVRCDGNILSGTGNYIEVPVAGGLGSLIRFKVAPVNQDDVIVVMSNGVLAERPDGSMMAAIERVQGQVDAMVPVLAQAAGVPTTTFQTAPNNVNLKQFGDEVTNHEARIDVLEANSNPVQSGVYIPTISNTVNISASSIGGFRFVRVGSIVMVDGVFALSPTAAGNTLTVFEISLPIPSALTGGNELSGQGIFSETTNSANMRVLSNGLNARASFASGATGNNSCTIHFMYRIV